MYIQRQDESRQVWEKARRRAFWFKVRSKVQRQKSAILNFTEVAKQLQLRTPLYRGVKEIPLSQIVGSVGRYDDFVDTFLPTTEALKGRWQNIARFYLNPERNNLPPIEVYKVGDAYFVKDGNHRVSVANQLGRIDIEACVWEYPETVMGLAATRDVDAALLETERQKFLEKTGLSTMLADDDLRFTSPGGYDLILGQMLYYQYVLSQTDGQELPFSEAAKTWYALLYQPAIAAITKTGLMTLFPERTSADHYMWVIEHCRELDKLYRKSVFIEQSARNLISKYQPRLPLRWGRKFMHWLRRGLYGGRLVMQA